MGNLRRWALLLAMVGWLQASGPVSAQKNREPARTIQDDAGLFSAAAKDKANAEIDDIKRQFKRDFLVETVGEKKFAGEDAKAVNTAVNKWAAEKFKNQAINGIYLVVVKDPGKFRVVVGPNTMQSGLFIKSNRDELVKISGSKIKEDPDGALQQATAYVHRTLSQNSRTSQAVAPAGAPPRGAAGGWPPWATYLCIGLVVLLVIWLVMGVARGISGAAGGGGGGGGGGGFGGLRGRVWGGGGIRGIV